MIARHRIRDFKPTGYRALVQIESHAQGLLLPERKFDDDVPRAHYAKVLRVGGGIRKGACHDVPVKPGDRVYLLDDGLMRVEGGHLIPCDSILAVIAPPEA